MKVIHFKNRMLPFLFSQWSHEGRFLHIAISLPRPWQRPCFSIGWQRSLPAPYLYAYLIHHKLLCHPITLTPIHNGGGPGSEEVLFTNCNFRFLFTWSSRASLYMTDVHELSYKPMICLPPTWLDIHEKWSMGYCDNMAPFDIGLEMYLLGTTSKTIFIWWISSMFICVKGKIFLLQNTSQTNRHWKKSIGTNGTSGCKC